MLAAAALLIVVAGGRALFSSDDVATDVLGISIERSEVDALKLQTVAPDEELARWDTALVRIVTSTCAGDDRVGTGVLVDGLVMTNQHVVARARSVTVETLDGGRFEAATMRQSSSIDLAALVVPELDGGLALAESDAAPGERLSMPGFPAGEGLTLATVSVVDRTRGVGFPDPPRPWTLDTVVVPGQSGSPLIDADGKLAGLLYARAHQGGNGLVIGASDLDSHHGTLAPVAFDECA